MATGKSTNYELPFPLSADNVNVHGDIKSLAEKLDILLPQASYVDIPVKNASNSVILPGSPVFILGHDGTNVLVASTIPEVTSPILGLARASIQPGSTGQIVVAGIINGVNTSSYTAGDILYLAEHGGLTKIKTPQAGPAVATVVHASIDGIIIVGSKGNATWGSLKAGLA